MIQGPGSLSLQFSQLCLPHMWAPSSDSRMAAAGICSPLQKHPEGEEAERIKKTFPEAPRRCPLVPSQWAKLGTMPIVGSILVVRGRLFADAWVTAVLTDYRWSCCDQAGIFRVYAWRWPVPRPHGVEVDWRLKHARTPPLSAWCSHVHLQSILLSI